MKPLTFLIIASIFFILFIQAHEEVHSEIYKIYGIDSRISWFDYFPTVVTIAEDKCPSDSCRLAHNINDIIGYPITIFYSLWILLTVLKILDKEKIHSQLN